MEKITTMVGEYNLFPSEKVTTAGVGVEIVENDRKMSTYCSGDYLGLARNQEVVDAHIAILQDRGNTASGSRCVIGTQDVHREAERVIADFQNTEDAVLFYLVFVASASVVPALVHSEWASHAPRYGVKLPPVGQVAIFADQYAHPTLLAALTLANPAGRDSVRLYRHRDMTALGKLLRESKAQTKLIATDGMFSANGLLAPLPDLVQLANEYQAILVVDDAHATGVLGAPGQGTWEHFGITPKDIDVKICSTAKAFAAGLGGFLSGPKWLTDYIRINGLHYIFGGSIPPGNARAITTAIRIAQREPERRLKLLENANYLRSKLESRDFDTLGAEHHILPILIEDEQHALDIEENLARKGIKVKAFYFPAVPRGKAIIRTNLTALHTTKHLDRFFEAFLESCAVWVAGKQAAIRSGQKTRFKSASI